MSTLTWWRRSHAVVFLISLTISVAPAQTFTTLFNFDGTNGSNPEYVSLIQGIDGDLYGSTYNGGASSYGTIFKFNLGGTLITLHSFDLGDGAYPGAGLLQAADGNFYGSTIQGGAYNQGTIFKITSGGTLTTLHNFDGTDGSVPFSVLIQATDGSLYGTTQSGGANGYGTIFRITTEGSLTTLHSFAMTDGADPGSGLLQMFDGSLYGTTPDGGAYGTYNAGTIYEITPEGVLTTLYSFAWLDGAAPLAGLVQAPGENLYGTTSRGGALDGGTIFRITPGGSLSTQYDFDGASGTDGWAPVAGLIQATDENFYGMTSAGAVAGVLGTIFEVTPTGRLTTLHRFNMTDGGNPTGGLLQATNGNLYGTTTWGGTGNCGTLFRLALGLESFVMALPASGKVGNAIRVLGPDLKGATEVTFNGVPSAFTVNSSGSAISTTVPAGATTGKIEVTTLKGTLSSNVVFKVRP